MTTETDGNAIRVAVPTASSGGLLAKSSEHFGHCRYFTLVEVVDGKPTKTFVIENPPHQDCFGPVQLLASQGATAVIVQGIGLRPLVGFKSVGIAVYAGRGETVGDLVAAFTSGTLPLMDEQGVCGGGRQHGM